MQYVIQSNFDYSTLDVGFQWRHQATSYINELISDDEFEIEINEYKVVHISEVVKEEVDWGQTIITIAAILFVVYVLTHLHF